MLLLSLLPLALKEHNKIKCIKRAIGEKAQLIGISGPVSYRGLHNP